MDSSSSEQNNYPTWLHTHEILVARQVTSVLRTQQNETRQGIQKSREVIARNMSLNNNFRDPRLIFPEEIWLMIFKDVEDVNDLQNASSTCSFFDEILNKCEYLFELVFPSIFKLLPKSDVLSCRAVCRRWHQGVDKYLENHSVSSKFPAPRSSYGYIRTKKMFPFSYVFHWGGGTWSEHENPIPTKSYDKNPFIGRRVIFCLHYPHREDNKPGNQFANTLKLLENIGTHIWYLTVFVEPRFRIAADYYTLCRNILTRCPNLKSFCLYGKNHSDGQLDSLLVENLQTDVLPTLPFLEELDISVEGNVLFSAHIKTKLMQKYCNQLKYLKIAYWFPNNSLEWSRLEQIQLFVGRANRKSLLQYLTQLDANEVKKLSINIGLDYSQNQIIEHVPYLKELLQLCCHFPKLRTLELQMEHNFDKILDQEISELPKTYNCCTSLTVLKLNLENLKIPFSFLVCFPLLERLEITHTKPDLMNGRSPKHFYVERLGVVDIAQYIVEDKNGKELYKSNIWQMLPALTVLKVDRYPAHTFHIYTREGYDVFSRKQERLKRNGLLKYKNL